MKYQKIVNNKVQCLICPRKCILGEGQKGFCNVRENKNSEIISTTYGYNTGLSLDPIEKKPLYHFYPASKILSFGTTGCIMGCKFCQNFHISRSSKDPKTLNKTMPKDIVKISKENGIKSVAFTYNDPIAFFEYALDCAKLCKETNIKTVAVTSGYINLEPAKEFFKYMDGANIDLKGFSEKFYGRNCLAKLQPVLDTIKYVKNETNCHLELTTLIIEGENNSKDELMGEFDWIIKNLGDETPLHLSAFVPKYKFMDRKPTSFSALVAAYKLAKSAGLKNVYTGNLSTVQTSSTYCPKCNKAVIVREGYKIKGYGIKEGCCIHCGCKIEGRF